MKKRYIIPVVCMITAISSSCILKYMEKCRWRKESFRLSLEKAGIPDQMDIDDQTQIENSNMVSEGSQFGVEYFNEFAEEQLKQ